MENILIRLQEVVVLYGLNLIAALIIFFVGRWCATLIRKMLILMMVKKNVDPTLQGFVSHLAGIF